MPSELAVIFFRVLAGASGHPANNRNFPIIPQTSKPFRKKWLNHQIPVTNKLYPHLCCLQYFLNTISPGNDMKEKVQTLLSLFSEVDVSAMGIPSRLGGRAAVEVKNLPKLSLFPNIFRTFGADN